VLGAHTLGVVAPLVLPKLLPRGEEHEDLLERALGERALDDAEGRARL